jgi:hypothetical protein
VTHGGEICDRSCVHRSGCASSSQIRGQREEYKGLTVSASYRLHRPLAPYVTYPTVRNELVTRFRDSLTTFEDNLYTMEVYLEGMKFQVSDTAV